MQLPIESITGFTSSYLQISHFVFSKAPHMVLPLALQHTKFNQYSREKGTSVLISTNNSITWRKDATYLMKEA